MALYHKYRPQNFAEIIGQAHVTTTLQNLVKSGGFSHAYLFFGPQGTGKTSAARILARAVNCTGEVKPCNACESCKILLRGALDLIELDAASHSGVDTVRETIRDAAHFQPTMVEYKVYIIDEVHGLSRQAFDALLKILEEPPRHLIFILATTEFDRVPRTVVSRCQLHSFHRVPSDEIFNLLKDIADKELIAYEAGGLQTIARFSNGCVRDAISLLDQVSVYNVTSEWVRKVLGLGREGDAIQFLEGAETGPGEMITVLSEIFERGVSPSRFIGQVVDVLQYLLRFRLNSLFEASEAVLAFCSQTSLSANAVLAMIRALVSAKQDLSLLDPLTAISMHVIPTIGLTKAAPVVLAPSSVAVTKPPVDPLQDSVAKELLAVGFELILSQQL